MKVKERTGTIEDRIVIVLLGLMCLFLITAMLDDFICDLVLATIVYLLSAVAITTAGLAVVQALRPRKILQRFTFASTVTSIIMVGIWMIGSQAYMSWYLADLRDKFYSVARGGGELQRTEHDEYARLEFGGSLDALVKQRDRRIAKEGFLMLGSWWATTSGNHCLGIYLYIGRPLAQKIYDIPEVIPETTVSRGF